MGVLTYEPYKSLILPFWAFRTVPIAQSSADALWSIFQSYVERADFVGADMTRKFIQMGMTRAKRYANWKGGRKYGKGGEKNERWEADGQDGAEGRKRREKQEASEIFKGFWRSCLEDEAYQKLKVEWTHEKTAWEKQKSTVQDRAKETASNRDKDEDGEFGDE